MQNGTYPIPRARSLNDADLLIPQSSAATAAKVLESVGFEPWSAWDENRVGWLPACTFSDSDAPEGLSISLDLHWRTPYTSFRSDPSEGPSVLWDGADLEAGLPSEEPHLLLLAEHFLKHLRVVAHVRALGDLAVVRTLASPPELLAEDSSETTGKGGMGGRMGMGMGILVVQPPPAPTISTVPWAKKPGG